MQGKVFISYRRDDSPADARSIYQRLEHRLGPGQLFMDVDSIPRGHDFRKLLDAYLNQCQVMLVVIGPHFLDAADETGRRRLDDPSDFVRLEIAMALKRKIAIIPVLVNRAKLPRSDLLPDDLQELTFRQAASLRHETFTHDVEILERDIDRLLSGGRRRARSRRVLYAMASVAALAALLAWNAPALTDKWRQMTWQPQPAAVAMYGRPNNRLADLQRDVPRTALTVEESPSIGRPGSVARRLKTLSNGSINLDIAPRTTGQMDRLDALSAGKIDAVWETPAFWARRSVTLAVHGGQVPLGLDNRRFALWLQERGALEINAVLQNSLARRVHAIPCAMWGTEGLWLKRPLEQPADLAGLRIRTTSHLFHRIAPKLGIKAIELSEAEVLPALLAGGIDGAELSNPVVDLQMGMHKGAKIYVYPSFHAPSGVGHLMFNLDRWNGLDDATRGIIAESCRAEIADHLAQSAVAVDSALVRLKVEGVAVVGLASPIVNAIDRAMDELASELAAADPDFKRTWAGYKAFR